MPFIVPIMNEPDAIHFGHESSSEHTHTYTHVHLYEHPLGACTLIKQPTNQQQQQQQQVSYFRVILVELLVRE